MSDKELLELARQAGVIEHDGCGFFVCSAEVSEIVRFAAMAAAAEREACAALIEGMTERRRWIHGGINGQATKPCEYAAAIRARGRP